jgi:hypothetical protein
MTHGKVKGGDLVCTPGDAAFRLKGFTHPVSPDFFSQGLRNLGFLFHNRWHPKDGWI